MSTHQYPVIKLYSGGILCEVLECRGEGKKVTRDPAVGKFRETVVHQPSVQPSHQSSCYTCQLCHRHSIFIWKHPKFNNIIQYNRTMMIFMDALQCASELMLLRNTTSRDTNIHKWKVLGLWLISARYSIGKVTINYLRVLSRRPSLLSNGQTFGSYAPEMLSA